MVLLFEEIKKNKIELPAEFYWQFLILFSWKESDALRIVYVSKFKPKNFLKVLFIDHINPKLEPKN